MSRGRSPAGEWMAAAIRAAVARITTCDDPARLDEPLPDGDTRVHQLRVGCRRLRSDLRTFAQFVDPRWAVPLRRELRWCARLLGPARDAEVLRGRLARHTRDRLAPFPEGPVATMDAVLARRQADAREVLATALDSPRYHELRATLDAAVTAPPLTALATAAAREVLPALASGPWRELVAAADALRAADPDEVWHAVRVRGKRARYAVEAVAGALGGRAARLGRRLAAVQDVLGEHQDAAVAGETWLALAASDPADHALAVVAGRLYERERAAVRRARRRFPRKWAAASRYQ